MPTVTVIIPAYNVEMYLAEAVASVLNQTYKDLELIIVDDASPDGTGELAEKLAALDPRARVIHHTENKRRSGALNTGLKEAKGTYISFLDADDWYSLDKTKKQVAYLEEHPEIDFLYGDYQYLQRNAENPSTYRPPSSLDWMQAQLNTPSDKNTSTILAGGYIPGCSPLIRKHVFDTVQLDENLRNMEDLDLWLQIIGAGFTTAYLPLVTYTYRHHENQKSLDKERMKIASEVINEKISSGTYLKEIQHA